MSEHPYERWLATQTKQLDPVMSWPGVVFALLAAFSTSPETAAGRR